MKDGEESSAVLNDSAFDPEDEAPKEDAFLCGDASAACMAKCRAKRVLAIGSEGAVDEGLTKAKVSARQKEILKTPQNLPLRKTSLICIDRGFT